MPAVQRLNDLNDAGAAITSVGQGFVYCNGRLVSVVGDPVQGHGLGPHASPLTNVGSSFNYINGKKIVITGNVDTCGHSRVGGSPNVFSD